MSEIIKLVERLDFKKVTKEERHAIYSMAQACAECELHEREVITKPKDIEKVLRMKYLNHEREVFGIILLNTGHEILDIVELFQGTLDGAAIYPREVVKLVLSINAAAVILYHNHPSGSSPESDSDIRITKRLVKALDLVDVRVLDHFVLGRAESTSFAKKGLI